MDSVELISVPIFAFLALVFAPIFDSVERKVKAKIHSRIGPPILQTWYDILKLFRKEIKIPRGSEPVVLTTTTMFILAIVSALTAGYVFYAGLNAVSIALLLVIILAMHTLSIVSYILSSNPYALIGAFRSITLALVNELGIVASFALATYSAVRFADESSIRNGVLLAVSLIMLAASVYIASGRVPYDIHEAEPELASGSIIEFSGPILGMYLYSHLVERFILTALIPLVMTCSALSSALVASLLSIVTTAIIWIMFAILSCVLGRTRVDLGLRFVASMYTVFVLLWVIVWIL